MEHQEKMKQKQMWTLMRMCRQEWLKSHLDLVNKDLIQFRDKETSGSIGS